MSATVGDLNPKTIENAKRQFVEVYGSALVLNTYLKIALVLVCRWSRSGLLGLNFHTAARYAHVKPLVIRIDEVGRAEAVAYDATAVSAAAARAALLPDAVRREALQPDPRDGPAGVSRLAAVPRAVAGRRHDRPERPEPDASRRS